MKRTARQRAAWQRTAGDQAGNLKIRQLNSQVKTAANNNKQFYCLVHHVFLA